MDQTYSFCPALEKFVLYCIKTQVSLAEKVYQTGDTDHVIPLWTTEDISALPIVTKVGVRCHLFNLGGSTDLLSVFGVSSQSLSRQVFKTYLTKVVGLSKVLDEPNYIGVLFIMDTDTENELTKFVSENIRTQHIFARKAAAEAGVTNAIVYTEEPMTNFSMHNINGIRFRVSNSVPHEIALLSESAQHTLTKKEYLAVAKKFSTVHCIGDRVIAVLF